MKPLFLETWTTDGYGICSDATGTFLPGDKQWEGPPDFGGRNQLAAAAPALVRALLVAEWGYGDMGPGCPACHASQHGFSSHHRACVIDTALTNGGFPDQA